MTPSPALPASLAAAIDAMLERRPRKDLVESARRLSENYRARRTTSETIRGEADALAYALTRMPATHAAAGAVFTRLASERPDFAPAAMLDAGCGLGAAAYAATAVWPGIRDVEMLDRSPAFLDLAARLAARAEGTALREARLTAADLTRLPQDAGRRDLVVAAYALTELADGDLPGVVSALWERTGGALVLVEPGTPRDHARLMGLRPRLLEQGASILAPCPHAGPCPLAAPDWCHFSIRLQRSREHRLLKGADAPFEDEKFSYLVAARSGTPAFSARILAPARRSKAGVALKLCEAGRAREIFLPKRDKARYEEIRRKDWGDAVAALPEEPR